MIFKHPLSSKHGQSDEGPHEFNVILDSLKQYFSPLIILTSIQAEFNVNKFKESILEGGKVIFLEWLISAKNNIKIKLNIFIREICIYLKLKWYDTIFK